MSPNSLCSRVVCRASISLSASSRAAAAVVHALRDVDQNLAQGQIGRMRRSFFPRDDSTNSMKDATASPPAEMRNLRAFTRVWIALCTECGTTLFFRQRAIELSQPARRVA